MLVSAFSGMETMRQAYAHAIATGYRSIPSGMVRCCFRKDPRQPMSTPDFRFDIHARDGKARQGTITMPRGEIRTPAFMPVGTAGP